MTTEWTETTLGDLIEIKHGFAYKGKFFKDEPTPEVLLTPGNFAIGGGFKFDKLKYYDGPIQEAYILESGDLLVTMTDLSKQADTLGYPAIVPESDRYRFHHNQRLGLVRILDQDALDKRFLFYLLCSREYRAEIVAGATGTTVRHTSPTKIRAFSTAIPRPTTQKRIGKILGAFDDKIELNHRMNRTLEAMAQAIFKSWFVDYEPVRAKVTAKAAGANTAAINRAAMAAIAGRPIEEAIAQKGYFGDLTLSDRNSVAQTAALFPDLFRESEIGDIPASWNVVGFDKLATLDTTSVKPFEQPNKVWEHYSIPALDESGLPVLEPGSEIKSNKYVVKPGAVLSSKLNPQFPRTWWPFLFDPAAAICSTEFMQFVPVKQEEQAYIFALITSAPFQDGLAMRVTGSTGSRQRAQPKQIAAMDVIDCGKDLRLAFVQITDPIYARIRSNLAESRTLAEIRDTLLPKLLSGEIHPMTKERRVD